jgi:hypothetical protein
MDNKISKPDILLEACKKNIGEWVCSYCNSGSGQPAAITRVLRQRGYEFEQTAPGRWSKNMFCPHCQAMRSHCKLLSLEPLNDEKIRCNITSKQRKRVLSICGIRDAFTGATIVSSRPEIDHKTPFTMLDKDINIKTLTDKEIQKHFQILSRDSNLLKEKACKKCKQTGIRPSHLGIKYYYEGNENYEGTCVGCGWYDGIAWRNKLNEYLNGNKGTKIN